VEDNANSVTALFDLLSGRLEETAASFLCLYMHQSTRRSLRGCLISLHIFFFFGYYINSFLPNKIFGAPVVCIWEGIASATPNPMIAASEG
jgi:hypothetical protein